MTLGRLALGLALAGLIALFARQARALTPAGALAATAIGGLTFAGGGWPAGWLLVFFFVSSSILSRVGRRRKAAPEAAYEKGATRDAGQVVANGAVAAGLALLTGITGRAEWHTGVMGTLAAVTADTWATEIGSLSPRQPRRITGGEVVPAGTSGAVTRDGLLAATGGAAAVALLGRGLGAPAGAAWAAVLAGSAAALVDSLLGATVQAMYYCPACRQETERFPVHRCGTATTPLRGWRWLDNDWVNFIASGFGAGLALLLAGL